MTKIIDLLRDHAAQLQAIDPNSAGSLERLEKLKEKTERAVLAVKLYTGYKTHELLSLLEKYDLTFVDLDSLSNLESLRNQIFEDANMEGLRSEVMDIPLHPSIQSLIDPLEEGYEALRFKISLNSLTQISMPCKIYKSLLQRDRRTIIHLASVVASGAAGWLTQDLRLVLAYFGFYYLSKKFSKISSA